MTEMTIDHVIRRMSVSFAKHLSRVRYDGRYLAVNLEKIFRAWAATPYIREQYKIDGLQVHEWVTIEMFILKQYRTKWQNKSARTKKLKDAKKHRAKIEDCQFFMNF